MTYARQCGYTRPMKLKLTNPQIDAMLEDQGAADDTGNEYGRRVLLCQNLMNDVTTLDGKLSAALADVTTGVERNRELLERVDSLLGQVTALKKAIHDQELLIERKNAATTDLLAARDSALDDLSCARTRIQELNTSNTALLSRITALLSRITDLETGNRELRKSNGALETENHRVDGINRRLNDANVTLTDDLFNLRSDNATLQASNTKIRNAQRESTAAYLRAMADMVVDGNGADALRTTLRRWAAVLRGETSKQTIDNTGGSCDHCGITWTISNG